MEALAGIVAVAQLALSLVGGLRLFGRRLHAQAAPEFWLAFYFVFAAFAANAVSISLYAGWSDPALLLPPTLSRSLNALFLLLSGIGLTGLYVFTWLTFRSRHVWARRLVWLGGIVIAGGSIATGILEDFEVRILPGPAYWTAFAGRAGALVWVAFESYRYGVLLRRRRRVGLGNALVANRFWLWGFWATTTLSLMASDLTARLWYLSLANGAVHFDPVVGRPILEFTVLVTSVLGCGSVASLFLTFFPTAGYQRWIERRASRRESPRGTVQFD
ncbi:MAG: hypothetical protein MJE66_00960 [Proteobacteria bacterium]|nr:hypothetical protein [Pseudomonadota bacterium]